MDDLSPVIDVLLCIDVLLGDLDVNIIEYLFGITTPPTSLSHWLMLLESSFESGGSQKGDLCGAF